ncbi:septum formation initiator family protein [Apibacter raozihei]|uniref:FtsB family cell division protein n=1 Tax=Apibacter TaxID=1778601 RepID=UPI000FE2B929|nr:MULTISPECIES: septum formation initiator family protein [Apibacter]
MARENKKIVKEKSIFEKHWYTSIYVILSVIFIVWMIFFDTNSYLTHRELNKEISKLRHEKEHYKSKLDSEYIQYNNLKNNKEAREKYARENYFFKKNNEDIFIIVTKEDSVKPKLKSQN